MRYAVLLWLFLFFSIRSSLLWNKRQQQRHKLLACATPEYTKISIKSESKENIKRKNLFATMLHICVTSCAFSRLPFDISIIMCSDLFPFRHMAEKPNRKTDQIQMQIKVFALFCHEWNDFGIEPIQSNFLRKWKGILFSFFRFLNCYRFQRKHFTQTHIDFVNFLRFLETLREICNSFFVLAFGNFSASKYFIKG